MVKVRLSRRQIMTDLENNSDNFFLGADKSDRNETEKKDGFLDRHDDRDFFVGYDDNDFLSADNEIFDFERQNDLLCFDRIDRDLNSIAFQDFDEIEDLKVLGQSLNIDELNMTLDSNDPQHSSIADRVQVVATLIGVDASSITKIDFMS